MIKSVLAAAVAAPLFASAAMAGPYVESKTNAKMSDGDWSSTQTELRLGYSKAVGQDGVKIYGEVGPGYEWNDAKDDEAVVVGEIGLTAPIAEKVSLKAKLTGEYGDKTEVFDLGGEVKVRYTF